MFALEWPFLLTLGVAAGTIGGTVGFGSTAILLPAVVWLFGAKQAVPIIALASLLANISRAAVWWREIDWRVNAFYCCAAVPAAAAGASLFLQLDSKLVEAAIGSFLIASIPARRWLLAKGFRVGLVGISAVGAIIGFLTGLVASTGPVNTPFFLAYGLAKGAFLATEAVGSAAIALTKIITFGSFAALSFLTIERGILIGSSLMLGSWLAKGIVLRLSPDKFRQLIDTVMVLAGLAMLWSALG